MVLRKKKINAKTLTGQTKKKMDTAPFLTRITQYPFFIPSLIILFLLGLVLGVWLLHNEQIKPVKESVKSESKPLPRDIKKTLSEASPSAAIRVPILFYHYVEYVQDKKDTIRQSLDIIPRIFDAQVKTLSDAGYTFLTAHDLADIIDRKKVLPPKPVLITFDDGHWDLATDVLPILTKYHAHATAYIISNFIGKSDFLSDAQLRQVIQSGLVEIGSHTVHHTSLAKKLLTVVTNEVTGSKNELEKTYGIKIVSFAYPNGSFDQQAIGAVKKAGYLTAVSTVPGIEQSQANRFFLYRLRPGSRTGDVLLKYLDGRL